MSECIEWPAHGGKRGYGRIRVGGQGGRVMLVHRLVWMQDNGHTDLEICHTCDNPRCFNIEHLYAGTHAQNMRDMVDRGRVRGGPVTNAAKTACPKGHPYDYVHNGQRFCRTCRRAQNRAWRTRQKEAAA